MQRTTRLGTKVIAGVTAMMFAATACSQQSGTETSEAREVTVEVWSHMDDESGLRQLQSIGSSKLSLDDIDFERAVIIDGAKATTNVMKIPAGSTFVVPLNNAETATVKRTADGVELVSFTGPQEGTKELPRGAVKAIKLLPDGFELFMKDSPDSTKADTVIKLQGLDELGADRDQVVGALALQSLLMSLEDTEQLSPPVAIALIAASVAYVWFASCGGLVSYCAYKCWAYPNMETQCAGLTVKGGNSGVSIRVGGGYSCRCTW